MAYDINAITEDCYENTTCLINKLGITDENQLAVIEADITFAKTSQLEEKPVSGKFDLEHYKAIHRILFEDLYDWAGKLRTINISKKGTTFADAVDLKVACNRCFKRIKSHNYFLDMNFDAFVENIVDLYCTLNMIHPFREGNGRTERIFIAQLIRFNGYNIDFSEIDTDYLMIATIQSAQGVTDNLISIFKEYIKEN
ncbi:MAG: Fic/DOC family protein [Ruminococcus sp.]